MQVRKIHKIRLMILVIALMAISFYAGRNYGPQAYSLSPRDLFAALNGGANAEGGADELSLKPVVAFQETLSALRQNYVTGVSKEQETKLTYAAIRGLLAGLEDPYTRFLDPEEFKRFQEENLGHFEGIGAILEMAQSIDPAKEGRKGKEDAALSLFRCKICGSDWENLLSYRIARLSQNGFEAEYTHEPPFYRHYRVTVVAPISGGPAEKVGLRAGDQIVKVNDTSTFGLPIDEVVKLIRGPAGTPVELLIVRKGVEQPIPFKIVRRDVDSPTVESKLLPDKIGYLRLENFSDGNAAKKFEAGLNDLREKGMKALLLDLRNNGGGNLDVCLKIAAQLLPSGPVVLIKSRGEETLKTESVPKGRPGLEVPMVVLVNQGSASASEILAGALQDRKAAKLVGERTFGKGLVQTVGTMPDGSALIITTAYYYTPLHRDVNKRGIEPDIAVKQPELEGERIKFLSDQDLQAKAALKLLESEVVSPAKAAQNGRTPVKALN